MTIVWTRTARIDLESILGYVAASSESTAVNIFNSIRYRLSDLILFPEKGRIVPELDFYNVKNYRELVVPPWRIIYKIEASKIYILAVFDSRRNFEDILLKRILHNTAINTGKNLGSLPEL